MMHQIYSSGIIGNEDCGRGYWGIDPNIGPPTAKNQWNSVMVNPSFVSNLKSALLVQDLRRRDTSKALRGFLIFSLLKSERRIEDGVLERAKPESLNFGDLARTDRPQLSFYTTHCVSKVLVAVRAERNHKVSPC